MNTTLKAPLSVQPLQADHGASIALVDADGHTIAKIRPNSLAQRAIDEATFARLAMLWNADAERVECTPEEYEAAVSRWSDDDINIDPDAEVSHGVAGTWVQAWVLIPNQNDDEYEPTIADLDGTGDVQEMTDADPFGSDAHCEEAALADGWIKGNDGFWRHPALPNAKSAKARYALEDYPDAGR